MLGWLFKPSCPCDSAAKDWIETRLEWLATEFDESVFNGRPIVLPKPEFFPEKYDGSKESVRSLLNQVCVYMGVDPDTVRMKIIAEPKNRGPEFGLVDGSGRAVWTDPAGLFEEREDGRFRVSLSQAEFPYPMALVGTMAHELAHVRLIGERRLHGDEYDNELLTDLTVVHQGLGIFLANSPRAWESQFTKWPDTDLHKPEYMSPPMIGWALAHIAWFRNEAKPAWARHLSFGAKANFHQGLRYLTATADSWYRPEWLKNGRM